MELSQPVFTQASLVWMAVWKKSAAGHSTVRCMMAYPGLSKAASLQLGASLGPGAYLASKHAGTDSASADIEPWSCRRDCKAVEAVWAEARSG